MAGRGAARHGGEELGPARGARDASTGAGGDGRARVTAGEWRLGPGDPDRLGSGPRLARERRRGGLALILCKCIQHSSSYYVNVFGIVAGGRPRPRG